LDKKIAHDIKTGRTSMQFYMTIEYIFKFDFCCLKLTAVRRVCASPLGLLIL